MPSKTSRVGSPTPSSSATNFIGKDNVALISGRQYFLWAGLSDLLINAVLHDHGARVFAYVSASPERYGVVEIDKSDQAVSIEEKPGEPKSKFAVVGLYFYDNSVDGDRRTIAASATRRIEITTSTKRTLSVASSMFRSWAAALPGSTWVRINLIWKPAPLSKLSNSARDYGFAAQRKLLSTKNGYRANNCLHRRRLTKILTTADI